MVDTAEAAAAVTASVVAATSAGKDWLLKALDPFNQRNEILGMPSPNSDTVAVLNYVSSASIDPPVAAGYGVGFDATKAAFDAELYLFQHPIVFGTSFAGRTGSKPIDHYTTFSFRTTVPAGGGGNSLEISVPLGSEPWTPKIYMNTQLSGDSKYATALSALKSNVEGYKIIYGGAQIIPTCSAMYNQGYMEATQQIFAPRVGQAREVYNPPVYGLGMVSDVDDFYAAYPTQYFSKSDFPTSVNTLSNPKAVSFQYQQGLIVPYQLNKVTEADYCSAESVVLPICTEYKVFGCGYCEGGAYKDVPFDYSFNGWIFPNLFPTNAYVLFKCISNEGVIFGIYMEIIFSVLNSAPAMPLFGHNFGSGNVEVPLHISGNPSQVNPIGLCPNNGDTPRVKAKPDGNVFANIYFINGGRTSGGTRTDIFPGYAAPEAGLYLPFRQNGEERVAAVLFKSISFTASMKIIFRLGFEATVPAGSPYSIFKHICPGLDEQALRGYIRASRRMKDAYEGYFATDKGHAQYLAFISQLLSMAAAQENSDITVSNFGGHVSSKKRKR